MGLVGIVPEGHLVGDGLGDVVQVRAGTVGIDIEVVLLRVEAGLLEGEGDGAGLGGAVRTRGRGMIGVAGIAVAHHFAEDGRTAREGVIQ